MTTDRLKSIANSRNVVFFKRRYTQKFDIVKHGGVVRWGLCSLVSPFIARILVLINKNSFGYCCLQSQCGWLSVSAKHIACRLFFDKQYVCM